MENGASGKELDEVFRLETGRAIGNDRLVRHQNRLFQVTRQSPSPNLCDMIKCGVGRRYNAHQ
jgi:hypothetical protein